MIKFRVEGRPVPYTRMTQRSKWEPRAQRYLDYKTEVGWWAKKATKQMLAGELEAEITFYLTGQRKIDIDNLVKGFLDGCNKICFEDDSQVMRLTASKVKVKRADEQKTEVVIKEIKDKSA